MASLIAVDARKAMIQVIASPESFEHLALDGSVDESGCVEFAVWTNTLIQWARPRIARSVDAAGGWVRVLAHGRSAPAALVP